MNANSLPTNSALRIATAFGLSDRFADATGRQTNMAWREAVAEFQKMIIGGTDPEDAKSMIAKYLYFDDQQGEDQNDDFIKGDFDKAFDEIVIATKVDGKSLIINELMKVASANGGNISWFDGKTKLEAIKSLHEILEGKVLQPEEERGILLKMVS